MTRKELSDNLSFLSALKMLEGLAAAGKLTNEEKEKAREELERRLRPTLLILPLIFDGLVTQISRPFFVGIGEWLLRGDHGIVCRGRRSKKI